MTRPLRGKRRSSAPVPTGLFIGGAWRPAEAGATFTVEDPSTRHGARRGRRRLARRRHARAGGGRARPSPRGPRSPPRERSDILRRAYDLLLERQEDLALLMTLEMGKPLAEARGEIVYAAEFFRWFSEEAVRIDGGFPVAPERPGPPAGDARAGGSVPADHAVELPHGHGHPQDRSGGRCRLHDGGQARRADAALHPGAGRDHAGGRTPRRRAQRGHHLGPGARDRADDPRRPGSQALLHRLHRRGPQAARAVRGQGHAHLDGAGRQRTLPRLRRRRPRRRRRGRGAGQDAQHRRGVHRRQPVLRALLGGRRVRPPARRADGGPADRARRR